MKKGFKLVSHFCEGSGSNNNRGCLGGQREGRGEGHPGK